MDYDIQKFISRLETMQKNGDAWLTINAVLSLLEDCKEPVFHLRSYGDVSKSDLESYVNDSIQARAPAPETADTRDEDDLHTIERAADLLEGYAAYIRNDGAENLQYHPYLPEVDMIAEELRMYATKRDVLAAELDTAIHARADESGASPLPPLSRIGRAGTGGLESTEFYMLRPGYLPFVVVRSEVSAAAVMPYAGYMAEVKAGFGRTMSRLPEVFGVSRTTLYNWLKGDAPKAMYEQRIEQLARAARAFDELGFKPTATMLDRTVAGGKSFLQLMSEGADGRETAKRMVRIAQRGAESRSKLDALLAGQKPTALSADDFGTPSLSIPSQGIEQ